MLVQLKGSNIYELFYLDGGILLSTKIVLNLIFTTDVKIVNYEILLFAGLPENGMYPDRGGHLQLPYRSKAQ